MGFVRTEERRKAELEELRRIVVASAGLQRRKNNPQISSTGIDRNDEEGSLVCVTSGVSYLGLALVNRLLVRGYSVRIIVDNPEDIDKLREMETSGEMATNQKVEAVMAKLTDIQSLMKVFEGCRGVFHTSAHTDPAGLSGYTKIMAEIEVKVAENVIEACARTTSIRKCVFTSSLAACVWKDNAHQDPPVPVINQDSWSNESFCTDKKLWYALGKMRAEKAAWRIAEERGLKLTTICPGLLTGPEFCRRNPTATIAYLKGAQDMYANGLLATVDVMRLAEAQVYVFKAMNENAFGRYICFDNEIDSQNEAEKLAKDIGMPVEKICSNPSSNSLQRLKLSNEKLGRLMSRPLRCYSYC
ncbi:Cinnamoyl-CoA reductase [Quillaja saponaria]|uniref:Cinnamoyl-CoA reductase n=1 Tax=Quillaja saponaria TaxID=32244 RepID=A0AAD7Q4P5_QUISA|nr:Cinnamoyl-CoA reductase [Quillaja saponaria]